MDVLEALYARAGVAPPAPAAVVGADPVLPTRFRIGEAAAAAIAACGAAAAALARLRGAPEQGVRSEVPRAAAALLSFAVQRLEGAELPRPALDNPTVASYPTRDGRHLFLHGGFPHLERGLLELLGAARDRADVARRVAARDAFELEEEIAARGLCGAVARSADEWAAHPQGRALAAAPLVEIARIGDAAPRPLPPAERPAGGLRVLDLTRVLAGPTCGRSLAEHGAEVLRVGARHLPSIEPFVIDTGHGKRSAFLDLGRDDDAATLRRLARNADVFVNGYRPGALAARGLDAQTLAALAPGCVQVELCCYGHEGPWRTRRGWEQLAQTVAGVSCEQGGEGPPALLPAAATDYTTGYLGAFGALEALRRRAVEGGTWRVRVSLARTALWLLELPRAAGAPAGLDPSRVEGWCTRSDTAWGRLVHLRPVVEMEHTPARWERPVVPLGSDPPAWSEIRPSQSGSGR